jgi:hypothetical protein
MSLVSLIDNTETDKNTVHSYLELYETLLSPKKNTAKNILEIGIGDFKEKNGGSIKLWKAYFPNAKIYALDILPKNRVLDEIINDERVVLFTSTNAYDEKFFNENILKKNLKFDLMLDDGPHTLESMKTFIRLYSKVMTDDGILIIEDIQSIDWWPILYREVPQHLKKFVKPYDLRKNKNRYDDMIFTIDKSSSST